MRQHVYEEIPSLFLHTPQYHFTFNPHTPLAAPQHVITPKAQRNPSQLDSARAHKSGATIAEVEELMVVLLALVGL
jgi:hypothetical protein